MNYLASLLGLLFGVFLFTKGCKMFGQALFGLISLYVNKN